MAQAINPINIFGNYISGRDARLNEQAAEQRNLIGQMGIEKEQQFRQLSQNPNATPEEFFRIGRPDAANSLIGMRNSAAESEQMKRERAQKAAPMLGQFARQLLQSGDVRGGLAAAMRNPEVQRLFADVGIPPDQMDLNDPELEQDLQQWAQFAQPSESPKMGAFNPVDYTPQSFARFQQSGNAADLVRYTAPKQESSARARTLTPEETRAKGFPEGSVVQELPDGRLDVVNKRETLSGAEQKTIREAKMRMPRLNAALRRVDRLGQAVESISKNKLYDGGPADAKVLQYTDQGRELMAASAQLMPELQALTRVPGIGSQSDLEARLASLSLPSLEMPPDVNRRSQAELKAFVEDLKAAYESLLSGSQEQQRPNGGAPTSKPSVSNW